MKVSCNFIVNIKGQEFTLTKQEAEELFIELKRALGKTEPHFNPQRLREGNEKPNIGFPYGPVPYGPVPYDSKPIYTQPEIWCKSVPSINDHEK